jgi:hypothetical protein
MAVLLVLQLQPNDESLSLHRKLRPTHGVAITLEKARELLGTEGHSFMDSIPVEETKKRGALGAVPVIYQLSYSEDIIRTSAVAVPPLDHIKIIQARDNWGANWVRSLFSL